MSPEYASTEQETVYVFMQRQELALVLDLLDDVGTIPAKALRESLIDQRTPKPDDFYYRMTAQEGDYDGDVEVNDNAPVARGGDDDDEGAYVMAWVWVPKP